MNKTVDQIAEILFESCSDVRVGTKEATKKIIDKLGVIPKSLSEIESVVGKFKNSGVPLTDSAKELKKLTDTSCGSPFLDLGNTFEEPLLNVFNWNGNGIIKD